MPWMQTPRNESDWNHSCSLSITNNLIFKATLVSSCFISTVLQHSTVPHLLPEFPLMTDAIQLALNVLLWDLEQSQHRMVCLDEGGWLDIRRVENGSQTPSWVIPICDNRFKTEPLKPVDHNGSGETIPKTCSNKALRKRTQQVRKLSVKPKGMLPSCWPSPECFDTSWVDSVTVCDCTNRWIPIGRWWLS